MRNLTKAQALRAYRAICADLGQTPQAEPVEQGGGSWPSGPVLCRDFEGWSTTTRWAVVWEEGPYEWPLTTSPLARKGVFTEPVNGWALGLYPS